MAILKVAQGDSFGPYNGVAARDEDFAVKDISGATVQFKVGSDLDIQFTAPSDANSLAGIPVLSLTAAQTQALQAVTYPYFVKITWADNTEKTTESGTLRITSGDTFQGYPVATASASPKDNYDADPHGADDINAEYFETLTKKTSVGSTSIVGASMTQKKLILDKISGSSPSPKSGTYSAYMIANNSTIAAYVNNFTHSYDRHYASISGGTPTLVTDGISGDATGTIDLGVFNTNKSLTLWTGILDGVGGITWTQQTSSTDDGTGGYSIFANDNIPPTDVTDLALGYVSQTVRSVSFTRPTDDGSDLGATPYTFFDSDTFLKDIGAKADVSGYNLTFPLTRAIQRINVRTTDAAGNRSGPSNIVTVDTWPPEFAQLASGTYAVEFRLTPIDPTDSVTLDFLVSDNDAIDHVVLWDADTSAVVTGLTIKKADGVTAGDFSNVEAGDQVSGIGGPITLHWYLIAYDRDGNATISEYGRPDTETQYYATQAGAGSTPSFSVDDLAVSYDDITQLVSLQMPTTVVSNEDNIVVEQQTSTGSWIPLDGIYYDSTSTLIPNGVSGITEAQLTAGIYLAIAVGDYTLRVTAYNTTGGQASTGPETVSVVDTTVYLTEMASVSGTPGSASIQWGWTNPATGNEDAIQVRVEYSTSLAGPWLLHSIESYNNATDAGNAQNTTSDPTIPTGQSYYGRAQYQDVDGNTSNWVVSTVVGPLGSSVTWTMDSVLPGTEVNGLTTTTGSKAITVSNGNGYAEVQSERCYCKLADANVVIALGSVIKDLTLDIGMDTAPTADQTLEFRPRYQDANNYHRIRIIFNPYGRIQMEYSQIEGGVPNNGTWHVVLGYNTYVYGTSVLQLSVVDDGTDCVAYLLAAPTIPVSNADCIAKGATAGFLSTNGNCAVHFSNNSEAEGEQWFDNFNQTGGGGAPPSSNQPSPVPSMTYSSLTSSTIAGSFAASQDESEVSEYQVWYDIAGTATQAQTLQKTGASVYDWSITGLPANTDVTPYVLVLGLNEQVSDPTQCAGSPLRTPSSSGSSGQLVWDWITARPDASLFDSPYVGGVYDATKYIKVSCQGDGTSANSVEFVTDTVFAPNSWAGKITMTTGSTVKAHTELKCHYANGTKIIWPVDTAKVSPVTGTVYNEGVECEMWLGWAVMFLDWPTLPNYANVHTLMQIHKFQESGIYASDYWGGNGATVSVGDGNNKFVLRHQINDQARDTCTGAGSTGDNVFDTLPGEIQNGHWYKFIGQHKFSDRGNGINRWWVDNQLISDFQEDNAYNARSYTKDSNVLLEVAEELGKKLGFDGVHLGLYHAPNIGNLPTGQTSVTCYVAELRVWAGQNGFNAVNPDNYK